MFFRSCPFQGKHVVFAGVREVQLYIHHLYFSPRDIMYLKTILPQAKEEFWKYLENIHLEKEQLSVYCIAEGSLVFP